MSPMTELILKAYDNSTFSYGKIAKACEVSKSQVQQVVEKHRSPEERRLRATLRHLPTPDLNKGTDRVAACIYWYRHSLLSYRQLAAHPEIRMTPSQVEGIILEFTCEQERVERGERQHEAMEITHRFTEAYVPLLSARSDISMHFATSRYNEPHVTYHEAN